MTTRVAGWLVHGDAGAIQTLGVMRDVVHAATLDVDFVWWARSIVADTPRGDRPKALRIRDYVARAVHFCRDPVGSENITPPVVHMKKLRGGGFVLGDCDDAATLSAALGRAVGLPSTFSILAFGAPNAPYQHVITTLYAGGSPVPCDTTRDPSTTPPKPSRVHTERV